MNAQIFRDRLTALKAKKKTYEVLVTFLENGGDFGQTAKQSGLKEGTVRKLLSDSYKIFEIEGRKQKRERLIALFSQYEPELVKPDKLFDKVERLTGIVPLGSPFYIERTEDEMMKQAFQNCLEDRLVFCRLCSARGLGKSSSLIRLREFLEQKLGHTVGWVDLSEGTMGRLPDFPSLLKFFTKAVAEEFAGALPQESRPLPDLQQKWRDDLAPGTNCMDYLEQYVFKPIYESPARPPLTLIIDLMDSLLGQEALHSPFLEWLRAWNERKMKRVSQDPVIWANVVLAYSTESYYTAGEMAGSPLYNVGQAIELKEFERQQVAELTRRYGLTWHDDRQAIEKLMSWIGGHPELLNRSLYTMRTENLTLERFLASITQPDSQFNSYLQGYLKILQEHPTLAKCFLNIIDRQPCGNQFSIFQLDKCGLIDFDAQYQPKPRFKLYEEYFKRHLPDLAATTDEA